MFESRRSATSRLTGLPMSVHSPAAWTEERCCVTRKVFSKLAAQVLPWIEACSIDEVINQDGQTSTPVSRRDALCEKLRDRACQMRTRCRMPDSLGRAFYW